MPRLSALDLLESRGLPRRISLLSEIEALMLDRSEHTLDTDYCAQDLDSQSGTGAPSSRHARRQSQPPGNHPLAWAVAISAMTELRRVAPFQADSQLESMTKLPRQPMILKVPTRALSAPDLHETSSPPFRISLFSKIEAETTFDRLEQHVDTSSQDTVATRRDALSRRHARTWNGRSSTLRRHSLGACMLRLSCSSTHLGKQQRDSDDTPTLLHHVSLPLQPTSYVCTQAPRHHSRSWSGQASKLPRHSVRLCTMMDFAGASHTPSFSQSSSAMLFSFNSEASAERTARVEASAAIKDRVGALHKAH